MPSRPTTTTATTRADADPDLEVSSPAALRRVPSQTRGKRRVDRLLDAAADVIAELGLQAATAEAIALRAKTAKGSLYQFFPNREAVVSALAARYADDVRAIHTRALATDIKTLSLERLIDRVIRPLATFHDRNPAFRRVFASADAPRDATDATPSQIRGELFESVVQQLDALFARRNPALSARERKRTALVAASIGQALLARRDRASSSEKKPILDDLRRILVAYLAPLLAITLADNSAGSSPSAAARKRSDHA